MRPGSGTLSSSILLEWRSERDMRPMASLSSQLIVPSRPWRMTRIQTRISHVHPTANIHQRCTLLRLCYCGVLRAGAPPAMLWQTQVLVTRSEATVERWMGAARMTRRSRRSGPAEDRAQPAEGRSRRTGGGSGPTTSIWNAGGARVGQCRNPQWRRRGPGSGSVPGRTLWRGGGCLAERGAKARVAGGQVAAPGTLRLARLGTRGPLAGTLVARLGSVGRRPNATRTHPSGSGRKGVVEAIRDFIPQQAGCRQGTSLAPVAWHNCPAAKRGGGLRA
jgi:hypothetical protein